MPIHSEAKLQDTALATGQRVEHRSHLLGEKLVLGGERRVLGGKIVEQVMKVRVTVPVEVFSEEIVERLEVKSAEGGFHRLAGQALSVAALILRGYLVTARSGPFFISELIDDRQNPIQLLSHVYRYANQSALVHDSARD